jgi:hypothetical protein
MADFVSPHSITGEEIAELWKTHSERFTGSLGRIRDARDLLMGLKRAPLPDAIASRPDGDAFRVDLPQKYTSTMQLINKLAQPDPKLRRPKTATSDLGERTASRIEKFANPAVADNFSNRDNVELLTVEAESCALVVPDVARFVKVPSDYYEDDGETIKSAYRRDEKGRAYDDAREDAEQEHGDAFDEEKFDSGFKPDEKRSRAAYKRHTDMARARNYPFEVRLVSRQQYVPLNPRIKGTEVEADGVLIRTALTPSELLKQKYIVPGLTVHTEPTDETEGDTASGMLWKYEAWLTDQDDEGYTYPYVAYSVMGRATENERNGFEQKAVIDLYKQCGLRSNPWVLGYGWRWFSVDPDKRGMPYTMPFGRTWLALDAFLTGKAFAGWSEGMLAWFMEMPDSITDQAMLQAYNEFCANNPLVIEPFKITRTWGKMTPAVHPGTNRDVTEMATILGGAASSEIISPLARGVGDAGSAIERTVVSNDTIAGVMDIRGANLAMRRQVGERILEICTGVARKHKKPVLIYGNTEEPTDRGKDASPTKAIIELKPDWLGPEGQESFDLEAYYPEQLGDKLAEKAQLFGFWESGAITDEQWCTAIGVSDPDRYIAELIYNKWRKGDQGIQVMMADAARYLGDQELVSLFDAQKSGAAGPEGQPMGVLAGLMPPMGPQMAMNGMGGGGMPPDAQAMTAIQDPAMQQSAAIAGAARSLDASSVGPTPQEMGV